MSERYRAPLSRLATVVRKREAVNVSSRLSRLNFVRIQVIVCSAMLCGLVCLSLYTALFTCCVLINPVVQPAAIGDNSPVIIVDRIPDTVNNWRTDNVRHTNNARRIFTDTDRSSSLAKRRFKEDEEEDVFDNDDWEYPPKQRTPNHPTGGMQRVKQNGARQLPQAIIIGVKKGGTRALLEFIRVHPDVRAPGPESHFFDRHYERGLQWYREQMPLTIDGQITIEKTPSYFITKSVPSRVYNMSRDVKLIVVVRDPVTRTVSDYTQAVSKRPDLPAFHRMAFVDNSSGLVDTSWGAIRIGVYAKHLERWLRFFPLKQIHFVSGERLISDPAGELKDVQDFLGLKQIIGEKHFYFNTTKGFPCLKKPEGSSSPHCLGKTKGRHHPYIEQRYLQRLREFYRPFNQKFYQLTGQNFGWL